jgi:histidine triad (HIT) family protein
MYNHTSPDDICPICPAIKGIENEQTLIKQSDIVYRDEYVTAFISTFFKKNNPGHVIIVPNEHIENIYDLPDAISHKIQDLSKKIAIGLKETYKCDGVSTAQHNEPAGDQHAFHYHFHIFPRYYNDDLYLHIMEKTFPSQEERAVYAEKIKSFFMNAKRPS